jgi:hypothetical protein
MRGKTARLENTIPSGMIFLINLINSLALMHRLARKSNPRRVP